MNSIIKEGHSGVLLKNSGVKKCNNKINCLVKDHYNKLALISRIRKDIRCGVEAYVIQRYIIKEFPKLNSHLEEEEKQLLPKIETSDPLRIAAENQHNQLRTLVQRFSYKNSIQLVEEFANLMEEHIRFEERSLYPHINELIDMHEVKSKHNVNNLPGLNGSATNMHEQFS